MKRTISRMHRLNKRRLSPTAERIRQGFECGRPTGDAIEQVYEGLPDELADFSGFDDRLQDIAEPLIVLATIADEECTGSRPICLAPGVR